MADIPLIGPLDAPGLHIMTFNVRRPMPHASWRHPDWWARRAPLVRRLLTSERPAVLGVQEALAAQMTVIRNGLGPGYASVGRGRTATGNGEHSALFYDTDRLELLHWFQNALSDTPDVPGSATWGNRIRRIVVVAVFRDLATGVPFMAVNTHLDHLSGASRLRSARAILDAVRHEPAVVVMGDFNSSSRSRTYQALTGSGTLQDSWSTARERVSEPWGTFPNYRPPRRDGKRIDWILAGASVEVLKAGINVSQYDGAWPSDHAPVQIVARIRDR